MLKPFISLSYAFLSHGLFGLGDKPNTFTRAFYFCSCVLLFCKGLKSKYLWEPLLFCLVLGKKWKKKDDDDSSALFQIMHFLSPGTVRKQQTIKQRRAVLRRNKQNMDSIQHFKKRQFHLLQWRTTMPGRDTNSCNNFCVFKTLAENNHKSGFGELSIFTHIKLLPVHSSKQT